MSGWTNQGITTLVIPTGATSGARVVIDGTTGLISVYNSSDVLVGQWGGTNGCFFSYPFPDQTAPFVEICDGLVTFGKTGFATPNPPTITSPSLTVATSQLEITSGFPDGAGQDSSLQLFGGTTAAGAEIRASQRGVSGDAVQTDTNNNDRQLVHPALYSGQVAGGDGHWVFAHNCAFTPKVAQLTPYAAGGGDGPGYVRMWTTGVDANNCYTIWRDDGGGITANGTTVGVHAVFWG